MLSVPALADIIRNDMYYDQVVDSLIIYKRSKYV